MRSYPRLLVAQSGFPLSCRLLLSLTCFIARRTRHRGRGQGAPRMNHLGSSSKASSRGRLASSLTARRHLTAPRRLKWRPSPGEGSPTDAPARQAGPRLPGLRQRRLPVPRPQATPGRPGGMPVRGDGDQVPLPVVRPRVEGEAGRRGRVKIGRYGPWSSARNLFRRWPESTTTSCSQDAWRSCTRPPRRWSTTCARSCWSGRGAVPGRVRPDADDQAAGRPRPLAQRLQHGAGRRPVPARFRAGLLGVCPRHRAARGSSRKLLSLAE
jgi:hypothetical protein